MKREIDMDGETAFDMLREVEKQEGVRVARILRMRWTDENKDEFPWNLYVCVCGQVLEEGQIGHVWAKPLTNEPDCRTFVKYCFCHRDECIERAMEAWADEIQTDVMAAYFGEFTEDDNLDLED